MSLFERQAPELRVQRWIGEDGGISVAPLKLSDLGTGPKILFAFQHWCRGCHAHGFPTLQRLHGALSSKGVGFAVIQTVFEGAHENTFDKLRVNQLKYELPSLTVMTSHRPVQRFPPLWKTTAREERLGSRLSTQTALSCSRTSILTRTCL